MNVRKTDKMTIKMKSLQTVSFHIWAAGWQKGPYNKIWKAESDAYFKNSIYVEPFLKILMINLKT